MKKSIILLIFSIFITTTIFSQEIVDAKKTEISSDIVDVVNTVFDKTTEAVQSLAESLKVPAEHVYEILVKQQAVKSTSLSLTIICCFIIGILLVYLTYKNWKLTNEKYNKKIDRVDYQKYDLDDGAWFPLIIFGSLIIFVATIVLISSITTIITGFINPEYGAIKTILEML
jgi:hypothetical protein